MKITETIVNDFTQFHEGVQKTHTINTVYRGQKSVDYKLIPKVGRIKKFTLKRLKLKEQKEPSLAEHEKKLLRYFKDRAIPYLERVPSTDWEWLAIGQHHGLATRLLDWSRSALSAAFFAVEKEHAGDSVVYAFTKGFFDHKKCKSPFEISGVKKIYPANVTRRIESQSGLFTVHENARIPLDELEPGRLHRLVIRSAFRNQLRTILSTYGIHRASLFPDLDGIASYTNTALIKQWEEA